MFFYSKTFKAEEDVKQSGIPFLDDYEGHPSIHSLIKAGCQILTLQQTITLEPLFLIA